MASTLIKPPAELIRKSRKSKELTLLRYPNDLGPHAIVMNFHDYSFDATMSNSHRAINDSVSLPIPANLQDNLQLKVGGSELGSFGGLLADILGSNSSVAEMASNTIDSAYDQGAKAGSALKGLTSGSAGDIASSLASMVGNGFSEGYQIGKYFVASGLDAITPGVGLALSTANKTAINPHVTVEFDGVGLKKHTFEWTFSPKNEDEAEQLRKVIQLFKQKALPRYNAIGDAQGGTLSRGLLTYPSLVNIFFVGVNPAYFWYFKPCMIASLNTNYSPQGLSIAKGGKPNIITMQIELQEASIHTAEDYDG